MGVRVNPNPNPVIEHLLDRPALDSDHAVFLAGLILSFDSSTNCYLVKYTDGITATLSTEGREGRVAAATVAKTPNSARGKKPLYPLILTISDSPYAIEKETPNRQIWSPKEWRTSREADGAAELFQEKTSSYEVWSVEVVAVRQLSKIVAYAACRCIGDQWPELANDLADTSVRHVNVHFLRHGANLPV